MRSCIMSDKEMRLQVEPKAFRLDDRIMQRIRQWVPNRRAGDWESPGAEWAATKLPSIQFAAAGRTGMLAAGNFGDRHTAVGEILWSSVPKTPMKSHGKLVLHPLWNSQLVQIMTQQPWIAKDHARVSRFLWSDAAAFWTRYDFYVTFSGTDTRIELL